MSHTIKKLSQMNGRVYVYFKTNILCQQFLMQAEREGFTFQDGAKPTERHNSDVIAVNKDYTIMVNAVKVFTLRLCISAYYIHFKRVKVKIFTAFTITTWELLVTLPLAAKSKK